MGLNIKDTQANFNDTTLPRYAETALLESPTGVAHAFDFTNRLTYPSQATPTLKSQILKSLTTPSFSISVGTSQSDLVNDPGFDPAKGFIFTLGSQQVLAGDNTSHHFTTEGFLITLHMTPLASDDGNILGLFVGNPSRDAYLLDVAGGKFRMGTTSPSQGGYDVLSSAETVATYLNTRIQVGISWQPIAGNGVLSIYLNGSRSAQSIATGRATLNSSPNRFQIGSMRGSDATALMGGSLSAGFALDFFAVENLTSSANDPLDRIKFDYEESFL